MSLYSNGFPFGFSLQGISQLYDDGVFLGSEDDGR